MRIRFEATALEQPSDLSLLARLDWNYFSFNNRGWLAAELSDGGIIITDKSGDMDCCSYTFVDLDDFIEWMEDDATDQLSDHPADFLRDCGAIGEDFLSVGVIEAALAVIERER